MYQYAHTTTGIVTALTSDATANYSKAKTHQERVRSIKQKLMNESRGVIQYDREFAKCFEIS